MEQQANYIRRIEIHGLWERFNIGWDLRPDVNILSGINGVGKTTILNRSVGYLEELSGDLYHNPRKTGTTSCKKSFCSQTKTFSFSGNYVSALYFKSLHVSKSFPYSGRS